LDGDYDGSTTTTERAKRHGCSNDIRKLWQDSLLSAKKFRSDNELEDEMIKLGLISSRAPPDVPMKPKEKAEKKKKWKRWGKK
jgi:hypothetical protein